MTQDSTKLDDKRLYIGNLDAAVDEYTIVKLFEPYGKITHLDYLFHKSGPRRGQPRGYCFLEYSRKEEALKAMTAMHSKVIKGRPLIVTFAYATSHNNEDGQLGSSNKRTTIANNRPTTISLLKANKMLHASTNAKIQALERKLAQMQQQKPKELSESKNSSKLSEKEEKIHHFSNNRPASMKMSAVDDHASQSSTRASRSRSDAEVKDSGQRYRPYSVPRKKHE
ncbi:10096_t:CDS:2 [Paraglomus occultum]|uniref:Probable RNA-binding protein 18 n=1 Tax=Paraglomus occultum TaxID=144539 RepID=A0A9N8VMT5_9GLOM|nr:10096_t:CDS:2 [Paraglomus occultum]